MIDASLQFKFFQLLIDNGLFSLKQFINFQVQLSELPYIKDLKMIKPITISPDDFYFNLNDGTSIFCEDAALAWLIMQEGLINLLNVEGTIGIFINCSDIFGWGCADEEPLPMSELERFLKLYLTHPAGNTKWCCLRRNKQPQPQVKQNMINRGAWDEELEALPE